MKVPEGWNSTKLRHIAEIRSGLSKSSNRSGDFTELPYLRVANVQDGYLDLGDIQTILVPTNSLDRYLLKRGDLLMVEGNGNPANLGRGCLWNAAIEPCVHQNHIFCVRPDQTIICDEYLSKWMQSSAIRAHLLEGAKGSTGLASLNATQVGDIPVHFPPLPEQRAIADTLSTWDTAIATLERLIAAKEKIQALARERAFHKTANSVLVQLGDVTEESDVRNNGRLDRDRVMAVTKSVGMRPMREETIASSLDRYKIVPPSGFAYNPMRLNIGSIAMSGFAFDVLVSPDYVVFKCMESRMLPGLMEHLRQTHRWFSYFEAAGSGGVRVRIHYDELARFEFWLPDFRQQVSLLAGLDLVTKEIRLLRKQLVLLQRQKRGLMQKLLTGTWRVPVPKVTP